jgi:hypothetical protein
MPGINIAAEGVVELLASNYPESYYGDAGLSGLANNTSSSSLTYATPSGSTTAKVVIVLGSITLSTAGALSLQSGEDTYDMTVGAGTGARRVEYNNVPSAFLASFSVKNSLGVVLATSGNALTILPS